MERTQDSETLSDSEKLFRTFFDQMPQLSWVARPDGFVDFYNKRFYEYTGYSLEELKGWGWEKILEKNDLPAVTSRWKRSIATLEDFEMKLALRRHDGSFRLFLTRATPILDDQGKCLRWAGINMDIQDDIDQSAALSQSERQFRLLADGLPEIVWIADSNFLCRYLNKRWTEYTGLPKESGYGVGWQKSIHPDDFQRSTFVCQASIAAQEPFECEQRLRAADGSYHWFSMRGLPIRNEEKQVTSWFGTCSDIDINKKDSEQLQKLAETRGEQLDAAEALNASVIEAISDGIVFSDPEKRLNYLNSAAHEMLEKQQQPFSMDEVINAKRNYEANGGRLLQLEELPLYRALGGQLVNDFEMVLMSPRGRKQVVSVSARPVVGKSGDFKGAVAVVRDITARKTAEIAVRQARDEAIEANQLKSQFLANISHEIRTPMSGIIGLSELLLAETNGDTKELSERIFTSAQKLMKLLNDLLDFSKAEAGKIEVAREVFHLEKVVEDACCTFYVAGRKKQIELCSSVDEALPKQACGDGDLIRRVLQNLVLNAIKFTEKGSVKVRADLVSQDGDCIRVKFSVKDTGLGISAENQKKLFRLFVQVDGSNTRRHGGTGLGLALSKRMVELMGGDIAVESTEGHGSTFFFTLPLTLV